MQPLLKINTPTCVVSNFIYIPYVIQFSEMVQSNFFTSIITSNTFAFVPLQLNSQATSQCEENIYIECASYISHLFCSFLSSQKANKNRIMTHHMNLSQMLDPWKGRSAVHINTALRILGFASWADLEPGGCMNTYCCIIIALLCLLLLNLNH